MSEFDSPWKEALDQFFPSFLSLFFPAAHADIDWSRAYESLDTELQQLVSDAELGRRLADKLFRVWRLDGQEAWVLVHVEVQSQPEDDFPERMFVYHYRIFDRYRRPVVSLAVLGDERPEWRADRYERSLWGCTARLDFPVVKLLDYADRVAWLEGEPNLFAPVVLAHLKTLETRHDPAERCAWKVRLVKGLFERGLTAEQIRQLFRLIDWLMDLPGPEAIQFRTEIERYQEDKHMPYVTSIERMAREEGLQQGRQEGELGTLWDSVESGLRHRFPADGPALVPAVRAVSDAKVLRGILDALWSATDLEQVRALIPRG